MRKPVFAATLAVLASVSLAQDPAGSANDLTERLSLVKHHVATAFQSQPDYTCHVTFDRYRRQAGELAERKVDTVIVEVAYIGNREMYAWPGEGKFSDTPLTSMMAQGLIGDGTFAVQAENVFARDIGVETFAGDDQEKDGSGRKLWRWAYQISVSNNDWNVQAADQELHEHEQKVGSDGSFWIDQQTLDLVKMETRAIGLLDSFPLRSVATNVNYGRVRIGGRDVLLPLRAELTTINRKGDFNRNVVEYSGCRQYVGQSTITFDTPVSPAAAGPEPPNMVESQLPAGLSLHIRLPGEFNVRRAVVGEPVEGILNEGLRDGKTQIAPKGAVVRGRVRMVEKNSTNATGKVVDFADVGLEFSELAFQGRVYHFAANLKTFETPVPGAAVTNFKFVGNALTDQVWPSAFSIDLRNSGLPKGTLMTWVTR